MVATVGTRAQVMHGTALKTTGGLRKCDLKKNAAGAIVSKKQSARAKSCESPLLKLWRESVKAAYANPKFCGGFVKIRKGTAFYKEIKKEYEKRLAKAGKSCKARKSSKTCKPCKPSKPCSKSKKRSKC